MKIKIGDRQLEVQFYQNGCATIGMISSGHASEFYGVIRLDTDHRPLEGVRADLWHEIMEMIDKIYNLSLSHQTITCIAVAINQIVNDNKDQLEVFNSQDKFTNMNFC